MPVLMTSTGGSTGVGTGMVDGRQRCSLENLHMNLRHAVDGGGDIDRQVCHMDLLVLDDKQRRMFGLAAGVNLNFHNLRHHAAQQIQVPFLQRLAHDSVVDRNESA